MTRRASVRRSLFGIVAALALPLALQAGSAAAATPPTVMPTPAGPTGLPAGIEDLAGYVGQSSCEPTSKPGTLALARLLTATYPGTSFGVVRACNARTSEHYEGRALDWMNSLRDPKQAAQATAVINWLLGTDAAGNRYANARRLGVMYAIWNNKIWGAYAADDGWEPYEDCAAHPERSMDTACHRDHIHLSLSWAGAMKHTSFWTRTVAAPDYGPCRPADLNWAPAYTVPNPTPCPRRSSVRPPAGASATLVALTRFSGAVIQPHSTGAAVTAVQQAFGVRADGVFGDATSTAVVRFKQARRLPATPVVDAATWRALLAAFPPKASPPASPPPPAPPASPVTPKPPVKPVPKPLPRALPKAMPRYGARGSAVLAVQRSLRVRPLSGWYGPVTRAAVTTFQRQHRLAATGSVDARTWRALGL